MVARNKSKKTTSSKSKKTGAASSAKPRSKRVTKAASSPSVRNRISKSKPASSSHVARKTSKTTQTKVKNAAAKLSKRKRTSSRATTRESVTVKRPASAAKRKVVGSKSPSKATRTAAAAKRASAARAHLKEQEAKLSTGSRSAQEARAAAEKVIAPVGVSKPSSGHGVPVPQSVEAASPAKTAGPVIKVQKAGASDEAPSAAKTLKSAGQRQGFKTQRICRLSRPRGWSDHRDRGAGSRRL